jgi:phosphatidylserine/phosphatidylglycerophosphate/cardiolipin synthase-like enzyme
VKRRVATGFSISLWAAALLLASASCDADLLLEPLDVPSPLDQTAFGSYEIYFTDPACPPVEERFDGLDDLIARDVSQAQTRVDVAAYDFDSVPMVEALIELSQRGVSVRMVTDSDNADLSSINRLRRNGISVVEDKRSALMHNKFIVIDDQIVWMGSMNFTSNGAFCNNNNLVRFDFPLLASNYVSEMDEMYVDQRFGPNSPRNTPSQQLEFIGIALENYFAPEVEVAPIIRREIEKAQQEILFMAFAFTDDEIGEAMLARAASGVSVFGVFEAVGSDTLFSYYPVMVGAGLPNVQVLRDGNNRIMHHKVIIIDQETLIFGSFNFSNNANESNDENVIIVHDAEFTRYFVEEFLAVWEEANSD